MFNVFIKAFIQNFGKIFLVFVFLYFVMSIYVSTLIPRCYVRKSITRKELFVYRNVDTRKNDTITILDYNNDTRFKEFEFKYYVKNKVHNFQIETNFYFDIGQKFIMDSLYKSKMTYVIIY